MEGSGDFRISRDIEEGPHQNKENKKVEGSGDFRISQDIEEGSHQKQKIKKRKGPLT